MLDCSSPEAVLKWVKAYAKKRKLDLNPNYDQLMRVVNGLVRNNKKYGGPICPCKVPMGDERDRAIECPCHSHLIDVAMNGSCKCRLFFSKDE